MDEEYVNPHEMTTIQLEAYIDVLRRELQGSDDTEKARVKRALIIAQQVLIQRRRIPEWPR